MIKITVKITLIIFFVIANITILNIQEAEFNYSNEDYKIYSTLINRLDRFKSLIIQEQSYFEVNKDSDSKLLNDTLHNLNINLKPISESTVNNYLIENSKFCRFVNLFNTSKKIYILKENEVNKLINNPESRSVKYKDSNIIITFSKVGYNTELNEALVYMTFTYGLFNGESKYFLLKKVKEDWGIQCIYKSNFIITDFIGNAQYY